jgi:hypothetical protein
VSSAAFPVAKSIVQDLGGAGEADAEAEPAADAQNRSGGVFGNAFRSIIGAEPEGSMIDASSVLVGSRQPPPMLVQWVRAAANV